MREKFNTLEYTWNGFLKRFHVWHKNSLVAELFWKPEKDEKLWIKFYDFSFNSGFIRTMGLLIEKLEQEAGSMKSLAKTVAELGEENDNDS